MAAAIIGTIIGAAALAVFLLFFITRPVSDSDKRAVPVGGMLKSDTLSYKSKASRGIEKRLTVKFMQLMWKFISKSDNAKHAKQTPPDVDEIKNIPYTDDGNRYHTFDVYYPKKTLKKLPVIIDIHGGGWMYAEKSLNEYYCKSLADRGFCVFNLSYRLAPDVTVNEQLQDIAAALKHINENSSHFPCDMNSVMLTGDSAGGQLSAYSAVLLQSEELRRIFDVEDANIKLTALLLTSPAAFMKKGATSIYTKILWGTDYKKKETYKYMNLDEIIGFAQLPPTYLITSSGDSVARSQTLEAARVIEKSGVKCVLRDYEKYNGKHLPHVFSVLEPFDEIGKQTIDDAVSFYKEQLNKAPASNTD